MKSCFCYRSTTTTIDSWGSLGSGELTYDFRRCHYLVGLALADLASVLDSSNSHVLHARAISVIHNLLSAHEADSRLTDSGIRSRVASLYLPLVTIVLDVAEQIHDPFVNTTTVANSFPSDDPLSSSASPGVNPKVALAIAGIGSAISPPRTPTGVRKNKTSDPSKVTLNLELSRQYLWKSLTEFLFLSLLAAISLHSNELCTSRFLIVAALRFITVHET
ncbi:unnamed protein product [Strongylus vulgaris]|uniref:Uncharacterized protein n=1 Tax=Strongylus vulgaris TaxID=40348 RepID=A0A3P7IXG4_STRVU|nr:unnamed protein product [Strongylus vulgaris]